jgi:acyl dehydratase
VPLDRNQLGVVSEPREIDVEKGQLRFFAKATGETNPIYFDEAAAQAAGHPTIPAPPTFVFSLHLGVPAKTGDLLDKANGIGVDVGRLLHGEQAFTYHNPIYAGDTITLTTTTIDIYEKKAGALEFVVQDTKAVNAAGVLCTEMRVVTVVRNG